MGISDLLNSKSTEPNFPTGPCIFNNIILKKQIMYMEHINSLVNL